MIFTVFGEAGGPDTQSAHYNRHGQLTEASSYRSLTPELPQDVVVDCDHSGDPIGSLIYCELGDDERLRAVAVIENLDLEAADEKVYFSPLLLMTGPLINERSTYIATSAELHGLALTFNTARVGAQPVEWLPGDVRSQLDRGRWPWDWEWRHPVLKRAHAHLGDGYRVRERTADYIVDRRRSPDDQHDYKRPPGPLRYSAPVRNSIISVR